MISFAKSKISVSEKMMKQYEKKNPEMKKEIALFRAKKKCLERILQKLELSMALSKAFANEFKTVVSFVEKFCKKRYEKYEGLMRAYFDFFMMYYTDFKLRTEAFVRGDRDLSGFTLVNQYNSASFNVIVNFDM